jgi:hypothetical protein
MAEERGEVGEALVERRDVDVGLLEKAAADAIDDRVRGLVNHDVVREAGEDRLAGDVAPRIFVVRAEIAEEDSVRVGAVKGVRRAEGMGKEVERRDVAGAPASGATGLALHPAPVDVPPQRGLEVLDGLGGHRIDHLLVKARIRLGRWQAAAHEDARVVEIDWLVVRPGRPVVIDDRDVVRRGVRPDGGTRCEVPAPHFDGHLVSEKPAAARIEGIRAKGPGRRPLGCVGRQRRRRLGRRRASCAVDLGGRGGRRELVEGRTGG